jgi:cytochrome c oxidase assembly protein subunit 15
MPESSTRSVHRWAVAAVGLTFALIIAGGLVTSRDAGLAVPDWPLSFGQINPPRWWAIENVRTEHGHRLIAGCVAVFTILLAFKIRRSHVSPLVRKLGAVAVGLVLLQAALGGLRVLDLSVDLAMIHGWLAQMFFGVLVAIATLTSPHWATATRPLSTVDTERLWRVAAASVALIVGQLVIGITIRHAGAAARPLLGNGLFYAHVGVACGVAWLALRLRATVRGADGAGAYLVARARLLVALVIGQILLGLGAFVVTEAMRYDRQATALESWLPTLHVALGAALLATAIAIALHARAHRQVAPAAATGRVAEVG